MGSKYEKENEVKAKNIFVDETSIELVSNENGESGRVDYVSKFQHDDTALEVSRFTNHSQKTLSAGYRSQDSLIYIPILGLHWLVTTDGVVRQDKLKTEIPIALHTLERMGLSAYNELQYWWFDQVRELRQVLEIFRSNSINYAQAANHMFSEREDGPRNVAILPGQNYSYYGPDTSLEIIEDFILSNLDNRQKLQASLKAHRHLWLWLDGNSNKSVLEAFREDETRLPARPPKLPEEITHLWVVNEENMSGWHYDPSEGWRFLPPAIID
jgi:hypothetical protein